MRSPRYLNWLAAWWLLVVAGCWPIVGQAQDLDPSFAHTQLGLPAMTSNAVQQADGRLVFCIIPSAYYNGNQVPGFIRVNTNGSLDQTFGTTWLEAGGVARTMRVLPSGDILLVGGSCSILEYDLYRQTGVVVLHPDGSLNRQFNATTYSTAGVGTEAGEVQPDGKILIGGSFSTVNNVAMSRLARLLPNGQLDPGFVLAPGGFNGNVTSIRVQPDGKIMVGGDFTTYGGVAQSHLARLLPTGSLDISFQAAIAPTSFFLSFALQADGKVVVALSNGVGLHRLLADGSRDNSFAASTYNFLALNPQSDRQLVVQASGTILLGGSFVQANGQPSAGLVRVLPTGALDPATPFGPDASGYPLALCPLADGSTVVCGGFSTFNHQTTGTFKVLPTGQADFSFTLPVQSRGTIAAVQPLANGRLLVGGNFTSINGVAAQHLAFLQADGTVDLAATQALPSLVSPVQALAPGPQGTLYVGGYFYEAATPSKRYLLRLTSGGSQDLTFIAPNLNVGVMSLGAYPDGRVMLGGAFTSPKANLLRLTAQGTIDNTFTAGFGTYVPWVNNLVVQRDERLAALTMNSSWQLAPQGVVTGQSTTVPRYLHALAVQPDGRILVAGEFSDFAGTVHNSVVRLLATGAVDASFDAGTVLMQNNIASIKALAIQDDGRILCAGYFTSIQGQSHRGIARLLPSGQVDATFADQVLLHPEATCMVIQPGGRLFVGTSALSPQASSYLQAGTPLTQGLTCLLVPGLVGVAPAGQPLASTSPGTAAELGMFPVPAHDEFMVQASPATTQLTVTVFDAVGRVVRQASASAATLRVVVADLPTASYVVRISTDQETVHRPLIVQH